MNITPYLIPASAVVSEEEIKKSRFITYLAHTSGIESAKSFVAEIKAKHGDARHNCWAFVASRPEDSMCWGFSDDGEPSGTAGKPILAQLTGSGVGEITAVVTRYYGGIRLGTGGLVKAYGGGVQQALAILTTNEKAITVQFTLSCEYTHIALIESILASHNAVQVSTEFSHNVLMTVEVDARSADQMASEIVNRTRGQVSVAGLNNNS
ncbi:YigZ family protein [Enterovibrio norvegicus FF-33]|uniref:YigZ family protein n=1 Tax=Enterovibrio norvegicus FF-454 TaxID=1185651 RepID=A0A1E5C1I8_9GAMM|nr:YigZ family protein [Enterovibrio norvegicus]OEE59375.1 YigZ family protein [Enterovibrio norvegicus FF-454]OEE65468.1 YigZ family protein [Enterovibrio norvegicus FF-33]OEE86793.1 YigZ family protein [Enterovibrio norvegicus FF-162]